FRLDGLLEGKTGHDPAVGERLREFVHEQEATGLSFALEVDGASFSLMPSKEPVRAAALGPHPAGRVAAPIDEGRRPVPAGEGDEVYWTLHSVEVRHGEEVQSVYATSPDGSVRTEERVVDAETVPPPKALTRKGLVMQALAGLGVLAVLFAISSIFIDWRE